jgi:hypothetical protein
MIMTITPPLQVLIKFRPYASLPFLAYKPLVGVVGLSLLIAYLLMMLRRDMRNKTLSGIIVTIIYCVILSGSLTRPAYLGQMAQLAGVNYSGGYPDPLRALWKILVSLVSIK